MTDNQNKIEKLIATLCPNGVEYKGLGEIGTFTRGSGLQKKDFTESGVGCIHYGQIYTYYGIQANRTKSFVSEELAGTLKKVNKNNLIIACTSENIEDVCKAVVWLGDEEIVTGGHSTIFKHDQNPLYIGYFFQTKYFFDQKKKFAKGTKVIEVSAKDLAKIKIPIPPIAVQEEIVKILNNFAALEEELEAALEEELEARNKQYEHYRSELLMLGDDVEYKELGDIGKLKYGFTEKAKEKGDARFIRITDIGSDGHLINKNAKFIDITDKNNEYLLKENDLLVARTGATYGKTLLVKTNEPAIYASFLIKVELDNSIILNQYYWHFAKTNEYWHQANNLVSGGGQPQFNGNVLRKIKIQIPPLTEQKRIVTILDKFDALVSDIAMSLPAELSARRSQYEYYRNKLLSFNEYVN